MRDWIRFAVSGLVALAGLASLMSAQITVPFPSFTIDTTIQPDEVNQNFAKFGDALNRTGGTMTGTLTSQQITPSLTATYDLGLTGTRFRNGWFSGDVATATVTASGTATAALFSGSGASLTSIPETAVTDGALLARLAGNETISGNWAHSGTVAHNSSVTDTAARFETGAISPTALTGNVNDYAPTSFATANVVRLSSDLASVYDITGLAGGAAGRTVVLCNVNTLSGDDFRLMAESASSTAANRFAPAPTFRTVLSGECVTVWYDGTSSRWRIIG